MNELKTQLKAACLFSCNQQGAFCGVEVPYQQEGFDMPNTKS